MLDTTILIDLTQEQQEFMNNIQQDQEFEENRYSNSVIEEYFIQVEDEVSNETISMAQNMVNAIQFIQETNNIVLCNKNRRCIVEEIANSYSRFYNVDTALDYVNYVIDGYSFGD
jgi:hypothetical protein